LNERTTNGRKTWALLGDLAKAYDKVWRAEVLLIMNSMGVTCSMTKHGDKLVRT
jgi:hypothetical protein